MGKTIVFIENGQAVTDSLTVAEVFGKEHRHVIRDIEVQIEKLNEAGEHDWRVSNFGQTQYQHPQNKQWYPKFNLTEDAFAIIAMSYVTPEAMKMKVKFLNEFKRMREHLNKSAPQTQLEILQMSIQQMVDQERRLTAVEHRQGHIEEVLSLNPVEWRKKTTALLNKIAKQRGGYEAYQDVRNESYDILEDRANCKLSIRQANIQKRMALEGVAKSKINAVSKLDAIAEDGRLTEIYLAIVKEMAIQWNVQIGDLKEE